MTEPPFVWVAGPCDVCAKSDALVSVMGVLFCDVCYWRDECSWAWYRL